MYRERANAFRYSEVPTAKILAGAKICGLYSRTRGHKCRLNLVTLNRSDGTWPGLAFIVRSE